MKLKYLFIILSVCLLYACKTSKNQVQELSNKETEVIEEPVEEYVPDLPNTNYEPMGDCSEDWNKRERLILYKDQDRIGKLARATSGQIFIITQVHKNGSVSSARIDEANTTVKKEIWRNMALELVQEYQFEPSEEAPKIECGTVKFFLTTM